MTWIALVGPEIEENLSLRYLASSLAAAGYRSDIIPFNGDRDFGAALAHILGAAEPPLCVGLSLAFQWRAQDFLALAIALRQGGYRGHVCAGGHFATFASRDILADFAEVDSIVRQEAEGTMVALVRALEAGAPLDAIAGLCLRDAGGRPFLTPQPALPDLGRLPRPDRRGTPAACFGHRIAPLVSSRGCYANCSFCCIAAWHEESQPGKRYRLRDVGDVADEMVEEQRLRGIDVFVFHDDNFFVPGHKKNLERFNALADALLARGIAPFATVVKARPTDVDPAVFRVLVERLRCIRVYIGVETDADQGLVTLRRWSGTRQNRDAISVVRELELYTCFNMLVFDPDTTMESLRTNIAFMRFAGEYPSNFGRVELYAGTPLLERMLAERRCSGDYMQWDYALASPEVERVFTLTMAAFHARNFGEDALNNRIMGTRFDVEICRHFHPEVWDPAWLAEGKALSRRLTEGSCDALAAIVERVERGDDAAGDAAFVAAMTAGLRAAEREIMGRCQDLARRLLAAVGQGRPLTDLGDRVATPLQTQRLAMGA
jgi:anaerobic magnesium-protoporphyrin IX monomethyl ester cyclase